MLKKQTVWLLTMLSLMIVLSVYYMTSSENNDLAYIDRGEFDEETTAMDSNQSDVEVNDMTEVEAQLFSMIRMELQDERSRKKDRLTDIVASSSATVEEKNEALDNINLIDEVTTKETILQDTILASTGEYEDVLVRSEEEKVHVHVKVDELSKEEANKIMQMVRDEFGEMPVDVNFQPIDY